MIPKVIHQLWGGSPLPAHLVEYVESWTELHPGWEHRLWDGDEARASLQYTGGLWDRMGEYIAEAQIWQARSDLFRMETLHREGGVYADADFQALRPLDGLCGVDCWAGWEVDGQWVNLALCGSVPEHPYFGRLLDGVAEWMDKHRFEGPSSTYITGPRYATFQLRDDVTLYPSRFFYPYTWTQIGAEPAYADAYAVHHWRNQRIRRGVWSA